MNRHNINTIARYEVKLLTRSWLFRIFAILALLVLTFYHLLQQTSLINSFNLPWNTTALTSFIPFLNTYFYNITQSIIAIFLAGSFLKRDKKLDTAEVIYVRPMSNADYVLGKTWGIIRVFVSLNIITLLIAAFMNGYITNSPFSVVPYLFYLLTISIPSLIFILGLSFVVTCLLKNQAVTMVVMLGIIGTVLFFINDKLFGAFDFFGVNIPSIFSDVTGHPDLKRFLLQRLSFLLLGAGLVCYTIALVKRLPHRPWKLIIINIIATLLVIAGCLTGLSYILSFHQDSSIRRDYILSYNKYAGEGQTNTTSNDIKLEQKNHKIYAESRLNVHNNNTAGLKNIRLYLNPSLTIASIEENGKNIPFTRENQVVLVNRQLLPEEECVLTVKYNGGIDENIAYLDIDDETFYNTKVKNQMHRFGKRYAYTLDNYALLTPEILWYPTTAAPVHPAVPYDITKDFAYYTLSVSNLNGKIPVSQGEGIQDGDTVTFVNTTPLIGISLSLGEYEKLALNVDSVDYEVYYFKGHDYFTEALDQLHDTMSYVIKDLRSSIETNKNKVYPFHKFVLAEVPVQFTSYIRNWKGYTEVVAPELVFVPEKAVNTSSGDFKGMKKRYQRWGGNEQQTEKELQIRALSDFFNMEFTAENASGQWWETNPEVNKYNIFPMLFNYTNFIHSKEIPVADVMINSLQNIASSGLRQRWEPIDKQQRANLYLQGKSFKQATADSSLKPEIFYEILKLKSNSLKNYILSQVSREDFNSFFKQYFNEKEFEEIELDDFIRTLNEKLHIDIDPFVRELYVVNETPALRIANVDANKVLIDDFTKYQVKFKINNPSNIDAIITTRLEASGEGRGRRNRRQGNNSNNGEDNSYYIIPAGASKEIRIINDEQPSRLLLYTNISQNIPNELSYSFSKIESTTLDSSYGIFNAEATVFRLNPNEIIVDNESEDFTLVNSNSRTKLKDLFQKKEEDKYSNFQWWAAPSKWKATVDNNCYGDVIHSAYFKKKGNGANKAQWKIDVPKEGYYELFIHNSRIDMWGHRQREEMTQDYTVRYGTEEEVLTLDMNREEIGWVSMGSFYFPAEDITITLSDKVTGRYVIADAIKIVVAKNQNPD